MEPKTLRVHSDEDGTVFDLIPLARREWGNMFIESGRVDWIEWPDNMEMVALLDRMYLRMGHMIDGKELEPASESLWTLTADEIDVLSKVLAIASLYNEEYLESISGG